MFKFEHYQPNATLDDVARYISNQASDGWIVVSHSSNEHGMTVLFRKDTHADQQ